jgi:hypothetical protein
MCQLSLEGNKIVPVPIVDTEDARYYAYNRFVSAGIEPTLPSLDLMEVLAAVTDAVVVTNTGFRVKTNPTLVAKTMEAYGPVIEQRFQLPENWRTTKYSFGDLNDPVPIWQQIRTSPHGNAATMPFLL